MSMDYQQTIDYLHSLKLLGSKLGLESVKLLLEGMGNPQYNYKSILVAGTNGKGSNVSIISSILKEAGYKVGTFTKPHLSSFTERIVVNDKRITEDDVIRLVEYAKKTIQKIKDKPGFRHPTYFEVTTAIMFKYFEEQEVDFAILEVGMGGRLDATNVVNPLVSVITNISLEHTKVLGDTVLKIAKEKAGIIKENRILVTATQDDKVFSLFKKICQEKNSKIFRVGQNIKFEKINSDMNGHTFNLEVFGERYENLYLPLIGDHQLFNVSSSVGAIEALKEYDIEINEESIRQGLKKVKWPGRLEIVQKKALVVLDCAKDYEAMKSLKKTIKDYFDYERLILVISFSSDKKIEKMMNEIVPISDFVIVTKHKVMDRAANVNLLAKIVKKHSKDYEIIEDIKDAIKKALSISNKKDLILVTGSLFAVGEAREIWYEEVDFRWGRDLNQGPITKK
jgi:dihydrofolate synthase/folylpolyglutamate synthase